MDDTQNVSTPEGENEEAKAVPTQEEVKAPEAPASEAEKTAPAEEAPQA